LLFKIYEKTTKIMHFRSINILFDGSAVPWGTTPCNEFNLFYKWAHLKCI